MAFYQKYRAKTFGEMVGQTHVVQTLLESVKSDKLVHAYLLTGPRGIGKTSTARLLAKAINCQKILADKKTGKTDGEPCNDCTVCKSINENKAIDVIEIDAASHTGVDDVRELIDKARLAPTQLHKKIYIIDEVHMLSKSAFNALLKTLEEPPSHAVFILATTETHKIPATVISRTQRFDFKRAPKKEIVENLKRVAAKESLDIDEDSLDLIAITADGGHRDALGLLEKVASAGEKITPTSARMILGIAEKVEVYKFIGAIFNNHPEEGLKIARELFERGLDLAEFNKSIIEELRQILLFQVTGEILAEDTEENIAKIRELALLCDQERTVSLINLFVAAGSMLKDVSYPILPLEMAIVKAAKKEERERSEEKRVEGGRIDRSEKMPFNKPAKQPAASTQGIESSNDEQLPRPSDSLSSSLSDEVANLRVDNSSHNDKSDGAMKPESHDTVPVPVFEMTRDIWEQVIEKTKGANATLAALLRDAKPEGLVGDTLTIGVKFKFHKDRISEAKHTKQLEEAISKATGNNYRVVCQITDGKNRSAKCELKEDLVKAVTEVFEVEE